MSSWINLTISSHHPSKVPTPMARTVALFTKKYKGSGKSAVAERLEPPTPFAAQFFVRARTNFGDSAYLARSDNPDDPSIELRCERDGFWSCQAHFDNPQGLNKIRFGIATNRSPVDWQHAPFGLPVPRRSSSRGSVIILEDADERTDDPLYSVAFARVISLAHSLFLNSRPPVRDMPP